MMSEFFYMVDPMPEDATGWIILGYVLLICYFTIAIWCLTYLGMIGFESFLRWYNGVPPENNEREPLLTSYRKGALPRQTVLLFYRDMVKLIKQAEVPSDENSDNLDSVLIDSPQEEVSATSSPDVHSTTSSSSSTRGSDECLVCMSAFKGSQEIRRLCCEHYYHSKCIDKWIIDNGTCPKCRWDVFHSSF